MIDILFFAAGRTEFTAVSFEALEANTDWRCAQLVVYTDGYDGPLPSSPNIALNGYSAMSHSVVLHRTALGGPIACMNHYLMKTRAADIWAKIDNDTIVPPGWLERCIAVMNDNPELGLLGIEPPSSTVRIQLTASDKGYTPTDAIGGIGVMRRKAFDGQDSMRPHSVYGGFTDWQLRHPEIAKGWLTPPLSLFLLDRLPMEPWASLSKRYIAEGQQRPWKNYTEGDAHLWGWWDGAREAAAA